MGGAYTSPPDTWLKTGQGREMLQFGVFTKCNKVQRTAVPPLPPIFEALLDSLQGAGIIANAVERPDTCVVNVYAPGSWLPPHVDSLDFERPFFTVSLLSSQEAVFGETVSGEQGSWEGPVRFEMTVGSVLRVGGDAAGPACLHALPRATSQRIRRSSSSDGVTVASGRCGGRLGGAACESEGVARERKSSPPASLSASVGRSMAPTA